MMFLFCQLKGGILLEIKGMKRRGESAFTQAKRVFGFTGNKQKVLDSMQEIYNKSIKAEDPYIALKELCPKWPDSKNA
jgi:hypothetical protein